MSEFSTSQAPINVSGPTSSTPTGPTPFFETGGWNAFSTALGQFLGGLGTGLGQSAAGSTGSAYIPGNQSNVPPPPPKKDNTPLFIGIGVFILLVIIILAVVLMKKK